MKRIILTLIIIFVLAGDGLALAAEIGILKPQPLISYQETDAISTVSFHLPVIQQQIDIPLPKLLFYAFYSGGVFNAVATFNLDYAIYGLPKGAAAGTPWVDMGYLNQCFPYPLGETYLRLDLEWHQLLGDKYYLAAVNSLAQKIRAKYNREHPSYQMQKIAIYMIWWPRSEKAYTDQRDSSNTHWYLLTAEK